MTPTPKSRSRVEPPDSYGRLDDVSGDTYVFGLDEPAFLEYLQYRVPYNASEPTFPDTPETVLLHEDIFQHACNRYASAVQLASVLASETVDIRIIDDDAVSPIAVTPDYAYGMVVEGDSRHGWRRMGTGKQLGVYEEMAEKADNGGAGTVSVPPIWTVTGTAGQMVGDEFATTLHRVLTAALRHRELRREVTDYYAPILAGAAVNAQFYNVLRFTESAGIGSNRTLQRRKKDLENVDILDVERVRVSWGRPRQQLLLGENWRDFESFSELLYGAAERV